MFEHRYPPTPFHCLPLPPSQLVETNGISLVRMPALAAATVPDISFPGARACVLVLVPLHVALASALVVLLVVDLELVLAVT